MEGVQSSPKYKPSPAVRKSIHVPTLVSAWFTSAKVATRSRRVTRSDQKRAHILWELVNTENNYLRQLKILNKSFLRSFKKHNLLSDQQAGILFFNIQELYAVHTCFRAALGKVAEDWGSVQELGPAFRVLVSERERYGDYARKYPDMLQFLQLQMGNQDFQKTLRRKAVAGKDLCALLQAPLQIISLYISLLKGYASFTHKKHPDSIEIPVILENFGIIERMCQEAQRASDDAEKIMFIVSSVQDAHLSLFSSESRYIMEGDMAVVNGAAEERVYGFLFSDIFVLVSEAQMTRKLTRRASFFKKNNHATRQKFCFHSSYRLKDISAVTQVANDSFTFVIGAQTLTLKMDLEEENRKWLSTLKPLVTPRTMTCH